MKKWLHYIVQHILRVLSLLYPTLLVKLVISKPEDFDKVITGGVLVIANHRSYWDPIFISLAFPFFSRLYPLRFVAKNELFEKPLSRLIFKLMGAFPSRKGEGLEKALVKPTQLLIQGKTVIFFPEGKRYQDMGISKPKQGVGVLVKKFPNTPIIPIGLRGTEELERKDWWHKRPVIRVVVGNSFKLVDLASQKALQESSSVELSNMLMNRVRALLGS